MRQPSEFEIVRVPAVINHADQKEEGACGKAMIQHLRRRTLAPAW